MSMGMVFTSFAGLDISTERWGKRLGFTFGTFFTAKKLGRVYS